MADITIANIQFTDGLVFFYEPDNRHYHIEVVKHSEPHDILFCLAFDVERNVPLVDLPPTRFSAHALSRAIWEKTAWIIDPNDSWEPPSPTPKQQSSMEMWQEFIRILKSQNDNQLPRANGPVQKAIDTMDWAKYNDKPKGLSRCQEIIMNYDKALQKKGPHHANLTLMPHGHHAMKGVSRLAPATEDLILKYIDEHYLIEKPKHRVIPARIYREFAEEFKELHALDSKAYPKLPCLETFCKRLRKLDQVIVSTLRLSDREKGAVRKRRKTEFVIDRILERVEFDAIHIAMGIIKYEGTGRKRRAIYRGRIVLMLAIDVFSRCILGYSYHIAKKPGENADLAVECFKNVLMPKADSRWPMFGKPLTAVSDGSTAATGDQFHQIVSSTGAIHLTTQSYMPWKKPFIERFMHTLRTQFLVEFDTYLGSKLFRNHDHLNNNDDVEKAVMKKKKNGKYREHRMTEEQFVNELENYLSIYHNNPHEGLGGYSPLEVWQNAVRENPKEHVTLPSSHSVFKRLGLKTTKARVINRDGVVTVKNAQYESGVLKQLYGVRSSVDVYYSNINADFISFEVDQKWHTASLMLSNYTPGDTAQRGELDRARKNQHGPEKKGGLQKNYTPNITAETLPEDEPPQKPPAPKPVNLTQPDALKRLESAEAESLANAVQQPSHGNSRVTGDNSARNVVNKKTSSDKSTTKRRGRVGAKL
ncbi:hypothetical protein KUL152_09980 [Tenacibaculum sp. KUL152]|nr:hypothetical protein KUL152_09980 [Tenacibaculum sp. KUL152]